jgi:hypothetical protein
MEFAGALHVTREIVNCNGYEGNGEELIWHPYTLGALCRGTGCTPLEPALIRAYISIQDTERGKEENFIL